MVLWILNWRSAFLAFISVAAGILGGCAGFPTHWETPRIALADIKIQEVKTFETVFLVKLRVLNTNDVPLDIKAMDCELALNGKPFASGVTAVRTKIPAYGTGTIPVLLYSSVLNIAKGLFALHQEETLKYRLTGKLRIGSGALASPVLPFASEGEVSFRELGESFP